MRYQKALEIFRGNWGKQINKYINYDNLKHFFEVETKTDNSLDDITWEDLNMNDVFKKVNHTYSTIGEDLLYSILRNPIKDNGTLCRRKKIIYFLQNNVELREKIGIEFLKLGETDSDITVLLLNKLKQNTSLKIQYIALFFFAILSILSFIVTRNMFFILLIFIIYIFNICMYYSLSYKTKQEISSVSYLNRVLYTANKLCKLEIAESELKKYNSEIKILLISCHKLMKKTATITRIKGIGVLGDYINILFLPEEIYYLSAISEIELHKTELKKLILFVGEFDALLSIASYRTSLKQYVEPIFTTINKFLKLNNVVHPLIADAVPNSITLDNKGIIITGSNMSGKSTFLRTIAINVIFAQTICTCLCSEYISSYFHVLTSINPSDNILIGKSYYMAEVESLHRIIKACNNKTPCFGVIDEIFRGTNPLERVSASAVILDYIIDRNALVAVATHDLELTKVLKNYISFYFREEVTKDGLTFDFTIKKGVSPTRNAVKILAYEGYPREIIDEIGSRMSHRY